LVCSKVIGQQPVGDEDVTVEPVATHGPPTPTAGVNVLGAETIGAVEVEAGAIEE